MKNPIIRTHHNFNLGEYPKDIEIYDLELNPSLTIPDQAPSLGELIQRYQTGREIMAQSEPIFDEHLNLPDVSRMDKVEKEMFRKTIQREISNYQTALADHNTKQKQEAENALRQQLTDAQSELTNLKQSVEGVE